MAGRLVFTVAVLVAAGCGGAGLGERCDSLSDCADGLQCLNHTCVPRCTRHVDCGDGHRCRSDGVCEVVDSDIGDVCLSEFTCGPGQACLLDSRDTNGDGLLVGSCQVESPGGILDDTCIADRDCRTGTCALGRCVTVCSDGLDCPVPHDCVMIPRELSPGDVSSFRGCLPGSGTIVYKVPTDAEYETFMLPVPDNARSVAMIASIDDATQLVGAALVTSPSGQLLYSVPFDRNDYFANRLRHELGRGIATLLIPQSLDDGLVTGGYYVDVGSYLAVGVPGTEVPEIEIVYRLARAGRDDAVHLDLHFHFLDLDDHPCADEADFDRVSPTGRVLDAETARTSPRFQDEFVGELNLIFARAGIVLARGEITYEDILDRPDLDGLEASQLGTLLSLSTHPTGVSVFFTRTLSPAGLQGMVGGPPIPPRRAGTQASGVAIGLDTLCYRDWRVVARNTAHVIARGMGLHRSIEPDGHVDPIADSGQSSDNLMYFSEFGSTDLSPDQRAILRLNAVLR
jgi:hypothetical protein